MNTVSLSHTTSCCWIFKTDIPVERMILNVEEVKKIQLRLKGKYERVKEIETGFTRPKPETHTPGLGTHN